MEFLEYATKSDKSAVSMLIETAQNITLYLDLFKTKIAETQAQLNPGQDTYTINPRQRTHHDCINITKQVCFYVIH